MTKTTPITSVEIDRKISEATVRQDTAETELRSTTRAHTAALADYELGLADLPAVEKARAAREAASQRLTDASELVAELHTRKKLAQDVERQADLKVQRQKAALINDERRKAFEKLNESVAQLSEDYRQVLQLNEALFGALPEKPDMTAGYLRIDDIDIALRKDLLRGGLRWALDWPWGTHGMPSFIEQVSGSHGVIAAWLKD